MTAVPAGAAPRHPWAVAFGLVLLLPQLVLAFLVVPNAIVVGLAGFCMTIGWIRLGVTAYRTGRERVPPVHRGVLAIVGLVALLAGTALFTGVTAAARAAAIPDYRGVVAPPGAIALNIAVIASSGVYICGLALIAAAVIGALVARPPRA